MQFHQLYKTPGGFSDLHLFSDGNALTGLCFDGSRDAHRHTEGVFAELPIFRETAAWLDVYFAGGVPDFTPKFQILGLTPFRREVSERMQAIPYGETVTYGEIAKEIAQKHGVEKMSAQAVGGAVGWNPLCIIVPCHRVLGTNGALTGYGGGIENKIALLRLEQQHKRRNPDGYDPKILP